MVVAVENAPCNSRSGEAEFSTPNKDPIQVAVQKAPSNCGPSEVEFHAARLASAQKSSPSEPTSQPHPVPTSVDENMVVAGVGAVLDSMVERADRGNLPYSNTCFHSAQPPNLSVKYYLARLQRYLGCSGECYILGLLYIDRLLKRRPWVAVTSLTAHRLVLCSLVLAAKFQDDKFYSNGFYARVGGLTLQELNALEFEFMKLLDWQVHTMPDEYAFYNALVCRAAAAPDNERDQ